MTDETINRADLTPFEQLLLRRFDAVDMRLDSLDALNLETVERLTALEKLVDAQLKGLGELIAALDEDVAYLKYSMDQDRRLRALEEWRRSVEGGTGK